MVRLQFFLKMAVIILVLNSCQSLKIPQEPEYIPGVNAPIASQEPSVSQIRQINRKYGMFIHFGINTFHDVEWTDGSKPAISYSPTTIDAKQWVATAKEAGMSYLILVTKHHDGFCLWDSPLTDYDVASSSLNRDVVLEVANECRKQGIELGIYYSLWDRKTNPKTKRVKDDASYNSYMVKQIEHLMSSYGDICELWLDGGWVKENWRWPSAKIYEVVKKYQPDCQIGINWSIGLPNDVDKHPVMPDEQKKGYPIRYFPSDFRLGDPYLPSKDDPKLFSHANKLYYMPWESTLCLSERWFYNTKDKGPKSVEKMVEVFKQATSNDNILIVNCAPGRDGRIRERDVHRLIELKNELIKQKLLN